MTDLDEFKAKLTEWLQKEWDQGWAEFAARHDEVCTATLHEPFTLFGDLEDCPPADADPGANFAYGSLLSVAELARDFDLELKPFPAVIPPRVH